MLAHSRLWCWNADRRVETSWEIKKKTKPLTKEPTASNHQEVEKEKQTCAKALLQRGKQRASGVYMTRTRVSVTCIHETNSSDRWWQQRLISALFCKLTAAWRKRSMQTGRKEAEQASAAPGLICLSVGEQSGARFKESRSAACAESDAAKIHHRRRE